MNEVFRTDSQNIPTPLPIPSNDGNGLAKGMLPRQYRMMHKKMEPTNTFDSELNAINMSVVSLMLSVLLILKNLCSRCKKLKTAVAFCRLPGQYVN